MELREALTQITEIRLQLARTEVFRGYRAMPVAFSGVVALLAGLIQAATIADPMVQVGAVPVAVDRGGGVSGAGGRAGDDGPGAERVSPMTREMTWLALEQFCPSLRGRGALDDRAGPDGAREPVDAAGPLADRLTAWGSSPRAGSCRGRPSGSRSSIWCAGLAVLALARGDAALSPWAMAVALRRRPAPGRRRAL